MKSNFLTSEKLQICKINCKKKKQKFKNKRFYMIKIQTDNIKMTKKK